MIVRLPRCLRPLALATACLAAACGDDGSSTAPDGGVDAPLGDPDIFVGQFTADLVAPVPATADSPAVEGFTSVLGVVYDHPQPQAIIWDVSVTDGSCVLRLPRVPFCDPGCGGSAVCIADDTCAPYATKQDLGTVHARGRRRARGRRQRVHPGLRPDRRGHRTPRVDQLRTGPGP